MGIVLGALSLIDKRLVRRSSESNQFLQCWHPLGGRHVVIRMKLAGNAVKIGSNVFSRSIGCHAEQLIVSSSSRKFEQPVQFPLKYDRCVVLRRYLSPACWRGGNAPCRTLRKRASGGTLQKKL